MKRLEIKEIIQFIESEKHFEAIASDGSFTIKVNQIPYPIVATAIHDGSNLACLSSRQKLNTTNIAVGSKKILLRETLLLRCPLRSNWVMTLVLNMT